MPHIMSRTEKGIVVLTLTQEHLQSDELARELFQEMVAVIDSAESPKVVIDFHHVKSISAAGLRSMLNFRRHVREKQGQLLLCGLSFEVADVFFTTRLASTSASSVIPFAMAPDLTTAITHLSKSA